MSHLACFLVLLVFIILFLCGFVIHEIIGDFAYDDHVRYSKQNKGGWGHGSYNDFVREFNKRNWKRSSHNGEWCLDSKDSDADDISPNVITFDGKAMLLSWWTWLRVFRYVKNSKIDANVPTVNWKA